MSFYYRHKKTGGEYKVTHRAILDCNGGVLDMREIVAVKARDGRVLVRPVDQHSERSTLQVLAIGKMQTGRAIYSGTNLVLYRHNSTGVVWARPTKEFFDGRFENIDHP